MNTKILKSNHLKRIIIILLTITPFTLLAQKEVTWDYPIKPGTEEWKSLKSYDEKLNAYNFPIEVLEKMNKKNLVKTCLAYPEFRLIMTRNSIQEGYSYIKSITINRLKSGLLNFIISTAHFTGVFISF